MRNAYRAENEKERTSEHHGFYIFVILHSNRNKEPWVCSESREDGMTKVLPVGIALKEKKQPHKWVLQRATVKKWRLEVRIQMIERTDDAWLAKTSLSTIRLCCRYATKLKNQALTKGETRIGCAPVRCSADRNGEAMSSLTRGSIHDPLVRNESAKGQVREKQVVAEKGHTDKIPPFFNGQYFVRTCQIGVLTVRTISRIMPTEHIATLELCPCHC